MPWGAMSRELAAVGVRHAGAAQRAAVDGVVEQRRAVERGAGLAAGHVDPLALAGAGPVVEGGEDGDGHVVAAGVVHVAVAPAGRRLVGQAGGEREAGHGLHDRPPRLERRVRARLAEPAVGDVDDVGAELLAAARSRSPCRSSTPAAKFSAHHVGDPHQLARAAPWPAACARLSVMPSFSTLWLLKPAPNSMPAALVDERRRTPQDVPAPLVGRVLDADHLRAEGGQELRGSGPGELPAEVADPNVAECFPHRRRW